MKLVRCSILASLIVQMILCFGLPPNILAQPSTFISESYGFTVTWSENWELRQRETTLESVDVIELDWSSSISVTHVGFMSDENVEEEIALDFLAQFISNDGTGSIVSSASIEWDGTLNPTYVRFASGSTTPYYLAIFPYNLPIAGTAFVQMWRFDELVLQSELDQSGASVSFELPRTTAQQVQYQNESIQPDAAEEQDTTCVGYDDWSLRITDIYNRMVETIDAYIESSRLPGLWAVGSLNMARSTIDSLALELLELEDPLYGLTALTYLGQALSSYSAALRTIDRQQSGQELINESVVAAHAASANQSALSFVSEMSRLESLCA